jgi:bifunctional ADP-heptose synthase (sugar kinase/adenylyltransferase)
MINYAKKLYPESCRLVIGINSDTSVYKMNKSHPLIFGEDYRAKFLDELCFGVIIFDEDTPNKVIMDLKPDVIVKGIDYQGKILPEQEVIDLLNIDVKYFDSRIKMSTTQIIQLVKESFNEKKSDS